MADKPVRADKATAVAELTEHFRSAGATVLTEYRGLTVAQLTKLRRSLVGRHLRGREEHAREACRDGCGISGLDTLFTGPTALAFVSGDPVEAAKSLREFAKANPALIIKGGVFSRARPSRPTRSTSSPTSSPVRCCWPSWPAA